MKAVMIETAGTLETAAEIISRAVAELTSAARQLDRTGELSPLRIQEVAGNLAELWVDVDLQACVCRDSLLCGEEV